MTSTLLLAATLIAAIRLLTRERERRLPRCLRGNRIVLPRR